MSVKVIDLFCGAGGLTHGLEKSGLNVVAGFDIEAMCRTAYESNNFSRFFEKDVASITKKEIDELFTNATFRVLAGCAPCQPFSNYTQGLSKENDKKWPLLYEFERLIKESLPDVVTMENVPEVVKHKVYDDFCDSLKSMGYFIWAQRIDCVDIGIPQKRARHVLLASRLGEIFLNYSKVSRPVTVRNCIGHLPEIVDGETHHDDLLHRASKLNNINKKRIINSIPGGSWKEWPEELIAACHRKKTGSSYTGVYGRMEWDKPSPTITTLCYGFGNGRFGHPEQHRAISLREAALLQTFPLEYKFFNSYKECSMRIIGRMIGNAVPVKLGCLIGNAIKKHIESFSTEKPA